MTSILHSHKFSYKFDIYCINFSRHGSRIRAKVISFQPISPFIFSLQSFKIDENSFFWSENIYSNYDVDVTLYIENLNVTSHYILKILFLEVVVWGEKVEEVNLAVF